MYDYELAIDTINEYKQQYLFLPKITWPQEEVKKRCYERYTAKALMIRLIDEMVEVNRHRSPIEVIGRFIDEMDEYYEESGDDEEKRFMFSSMREAAEEIIYLFL